MNRIFDLMSISTIIESKSKTDVSQFASIVILIFRQQKNKKKKATVLLMEIKNEILALFELETRN